MTPPTREEDPNTFVYGRGLLWTQRGEVEGKKCLAIKRIEKPMPIGAKPSEWKTAYPVSECDAVLVFESLEGARVLQDELNGLVSDWAKEAAKVVNYTPFKQP